MFLLHFQQKRDLETWENRTGSVLSMNFITFVEQLFRYNVEGTDLFSYMCERPKPHKNLSEVP